MALRSKFRVEKCGECLAFQHGEPHEPTFVCVMNPPTVLNAYSAAYPVIRADTPACFFGIPKPTDSRKKGKT